MGIGIKPPVIVDEHGSAMVFESIDDAERYLEPIDIRNQEYVAYDSEGRLLRLIASDFQVTVEAVDLEPQHSSRVRELLVGLLEYTGVESSVLQGKSLQELVESSLKYKTR